VKTGTLPATVHSGFRCIWIEIFLLVRFDIAIILLCKERINKQAYLTRFRCVVTGDGVMAAIEYARNVPGKPKPAEYREILSTALRQSYRYG
jgi:hypothetical protein